MAKRPSTDTSELVNAYPAIKLQEFYERMLYSKAEVEWTTKHALEKSKTLRKMPVVGNEWVDKLVKGWILQLKESRS